MQLLQGKSRKYTAYRHSGSIRTDNQYGTMAIFRNECISQPITVNDQCSFSLLEIKYIRGADYA
jgi:hypothetical protein